MRGWILLSLDVSEPQSRTLNYLSLVVWLVKNISFVKPFSLIIHKRGKETRSLFPGFHKVPIIVGES